MEGDLNSATAAVSGSAREPLPSFSERDQADGSAGKEHFGLPFEILTAGQEADGTFRVTGFMNTFKVMHSRRMLHPRGFETWLKKTAGKAHLPMLANHGFDVGGFATIGEWDRFELAKGGGMLWSGRVGQGTRAADDARVLLGQKLLRQLSVGAVIRQRRWIRADDANIDPVIQEAMEEAGATEVDVALDWYPVEGSVVDVADDPGARIAARADAAAIETAVAPLRSEIEALRTDLSRLTAAGGSPQAAALLQTLQAESEEFVGQLTDEIIERLQTDDTLLSAGEAFREDFIDRRELADAADDDPGAGDGSSDLDAEIAKLQKRVARGPIR